MPSYKQFDISRSHLLIISSSPFHLAAICQDLFVRIMSSHEIVHRNSDSEDEGTCPLTVRTTNSGFAVSTSLAANTKTDQIEQRDPNSHRGSEASSNYESSRKSSTAEGSVSSNGPFGDSRKCSTSSGEEAPTNSEVNPTHGRSNPPRALQLPPSGLGTLREINTPDIEKGDPMSEGATVIFFRRLDQLN